MQSVEIPGGWWVVRDELAPELARAVVPVLAGADQRQRPGTPTDAVTLAIRLNRALPEFLYSAMPVEIIRMARIPAGPALPKELKAYAELKGASKKAGGNPANPTP